MSRPGPGPAARRRPPPPAEPFISANEAIKAAQEEARKAVAEAARQVGAPRQPHPFETGQPKEKTSWAPNTKVLAGAGVGTPLAGVLIWVLGEFGVEMPWDVALYFAGLIIALVAYLVPEKKS